MTKDEKQTAETAPTVADDTTNYQQNLGKKHSLFQNLKQPKRKLVIIGAVLVALLLVVFVIIRAVTKKHTPDYASGDTSQRESPEKNKTGAYVANAVLPFANTIESSGLLTATVNGQKFPVEFTSWGGHSLPHAGGHVEGNNKSNFRIHILPKDSSVELSGNGNGTCDSNELCGVTAATAKANAPWYTAQNKGMKLIALEHQTSQDLSPYIPGETPQWRLYFSFDGGLDLNLQHSGEIAPELLQLIHASGQDSVLGATQYTKLTKPIDVSLGMKLARPQIIAVQSKVIGGQKLYQADAQTEWNITPTMVTSKVIDCQWKYFPSGIQKQLQAAMDAELINPDAYGLFSGTGAVGKVGVEGAAEGSLCASDSITFNNYTKISSNNSFGYYQITDATQATGEVMAVYPISKNSAAYGANKSSYASSSVDFMFRRGADVSGFADTHNFSFSLKQGSKAYTMRDLSGEIVDMATAADTAQNDHFTVRIDRGDNGGTAATMPVGKYVGVRYKIEKDKVIAQYGELADTQAGVKLPGAIPDNATCNAGYVCYIHDFSLLKH